MRRRRQITSGRRPHPSHTPPTPGCELVVVPARRRGRGGHSIGPSSPSIITHRPSRVSSRPSVASESTLRAEVRDCVASGAPRRPQHAHTHGAFVTSEIFGACLHSLHSARLSIFFHALAAQASLHEYLYFSYCRNLRLTIRAPLLSTLSGRARISCSPPSKGFFRGWPRRSAGGDHSPRLLPQWRDCRRRK